MITTSAAAPREHLPRRGAIVKRALALVVAGLALYGLSPKLGEVLGDWPHLRDIAPGWFAAMFVTQAASLVCMATLERIASQEERLGPFLRSYLVGNAVSQLVPGGTATSAALQYEMLIAEGVPPHRTASGLTAGSVIVFATLLILNLLALPLVVFGVRVPAQLLDATWISAVLLLTIVLVGAFAIKGDRFLAIVGRAAQRALNASRPHAAPMRDLPDRLLTERDAVVEAVGQRWWQALSAAAGKWMFDYLTLVAGLAAVGAHPSAALVLVAYASVTLLGQIPLTPGGLGVVEAGLTGALALIGVAGGAALLATLAYRVFDYWLYLPVGLGALVMHRRAVRATRTRQQGHH